MDTFNQHRREYGLNSLTEDTLPVFPLELFKQWFDDISTLKTADDPTVMTLSTVDCLGKPDSRIVLLKGLEKDRFIFYTNYQSSKAKQLDLNPWAALNFYWPGLFRQVRIRGKVQKVSVKKSQAYFATRPLGSQISAIISPQSQVIDDRQALIEASQKLADESLTVNCPKYWGGYRLKAQEIEFWQGRDNRLHDRILYHKKSNQWVYQRLAP